jgi:hypothetical protein
MTTITITILIASIAIGILVWKLSNEQPKDQPINSAIAFSHADFASTATAHTSAGHQSLRCFVQACFFVVSQN